MLRWINLALAVVLATLLLIELTRSREPGPAAPTVSEAPPVVAQERPAGGPGAWKPGWRSRKRGACSVSGSARRRPAAWSSTAGEPIRD